MSDQKKQQQEEEHHTACTECLPASILEEIKKSSNKNKNKSSQSNPLSVTLTPNGLAPLHYAIHRKHLDCVLALIEMGADIDQKCGPQSWAPFMIAMDKPFPDAAMALLDAGADVNTTNKSLNTAVYLCCQHGWYDRLRFLLDDCGADMNTRNHRGDTPLIIASDRNRRDCVGLLLDHGADVTICDMNGVGPIGAATSKGNLEVLKILLSHVDQLLMKYNDEEEQDDGHQKKEDDGDDDDKARKKKARRAKLLAELTDKDDAEWTIAHNAAGEGRRCLPFLLEYIKRHHQRGLLPKPVDVFKSGPDGSLPLHIIASTPTRNEQEEAETIACIDYLVRDCGCDVNAFVRCPNKTDDKKNAKHQNATAGPTKNEEASGFSPLYLASNNEACHVAVKHLLALGADPNLPTNDSLRHLPISAALAHRRDDSVELLLAGGADIATLVGDGTEMLPLEYAIASSAAKYVDLILKKIFSSSSSSSSSSSEKTPIDSEEENESENEKMKRKKFVLNHKSNGAPDGERRTPLELAVAVNEDAQASWKRAKAEKEADDDEDSGTDDPTGYMRQLMMWDFAEKRAREAEEVVTILRKVLN